MKKLLLKKLYLFINIIKYLNSLLIPALIGVTYGIIILVAASVKSLWEYWDLALLFLFAFGIILLFSFLTSKLLKIIKTYLDENNFPRCSIVIALLWLVLFLLIYSLSSAWILGLIAVFFILTSPIF